MGDEKEDIKRIADSLERIANFLEELAKDEDASSIPEKCVTIDDEAAAMIREGMDKSGVTAIYSKESPSAPHSSEFLEIAGKVLAIQNSIRAGSKP